MCSLYPTNLICSIQQATPGKQQWHHTHFASAVALHPERRFDEPHSSICTGRSLGETHGVENKVKKRYCCWR